MYIMGDDPLPNITPQEFERKYSGDLSENDLATAFALSSNKFWWVEDNEYDFEVDTPEHKSARATTDAWGKIMDGYKTEIFAILEKEGVAIPQTGQIYVLEKFMLRYNYIGGSGWWIKVAPNMVEAVKVLDDEQIKFICNECNITKDELMQMNEDKLYDVVYDAMCDIEMAEAPSDDTPESDHCIMASDIVTMLGNALAMSDGFYEEQLDDYRAEGNPLDSIR